MAPVKCYYADCVHTNATKSMFSFPIKDEPRLKLWIKHSGNANLASLTHTELKNRFICEDHFRSKDVLQRSERSRLVSTAVPLMYKSYTSQSLEMSPEILKVKTPQKVYVKKCIDLPIREDLSPSISMIDAPLHTRVLKRRRLFEDEKDQLEMKGSKDQLIEVLMQKNKAQQAKIRRLSLKSGKKEKAKFFESLSFPSNAAKTIAAMQLRGLKSRKEWTKTQKELCLSIYYKSPSAYIHMRRQGIVMAAPSTIRKWLGQTNCLPGLQKDVFMNVENHFKHASIKEKSCVLVFDEMSIMTSLEYSKKYDQIEGFQDFGRGERAPLLAKYVMVFLIRGLYSGWKLPIAYFLSAGNITANKLTFLIKIILIKLLEVGLMPKAIVSDQISTNQKAMKSLGVSPDSPFFYINEKKIFAFFDVPHALKNIRNNFLTSDLTDGERVFSFADVIQTYEIDKNNKSKCLSKITPTHLNPNNFQKMRVNLAAQILSRSVAVAIRTAVGTGELKSQTALDTANFIETINYTFDALNSKRVQSKNPYNCALTKHFNKARQGLINGKKLLVNLKKIFKKKNGSIVLTRPPSFDGFLQSIEAAIQMFDEESLGGVKYLLTNRLNQDVLENLFALFRLKAGFNKNPSSRVLRTIFRSRLVNGLMRMPDTKNCLEDEDVFIEQAVFSQPTEDKENEDREYDLIDSTNDSEGPSTSQHCHKNITTTPMTNPPALTLEECSVVYFSGYLAKKCLEKYQCEKCRITLLKENDELNDRKQLLILNKTYPSANATKLRSPSDTMFELVDDSLNIFKENIENMKHMSNLIQKMLRYIQLNISQNSVICEDHKTYIIQHLLLVKINDYCKTQKKKIVQKNMHSKLRILKNL